jgi:hypothetical protein
LEPSQDGREEEMRFFDTVLVPPQTTEARRAAKLPGQGALPVSAIEASREKFLRCASGAGPALEQPQLTLDPQQLRLAPTPRVAPGSPERFLDSGKPLVDLSCQSQRGCEFSNDYWEPPIVGASAQGVERTAH